MNKRTVGLSSGLGFYGDDFEPVLAAIASGRVHYVCSDHLAELTLAILHKDQQRDPSLGFARDLLPLLSRLWPSARQHKVRLVLNAGGLNPLGAAQAVAQLFAKKGWKASLAVITGDGVLERIDQLQAQGEGLAHMDTKAEFATVRERLVFANVYLGAAPIARALAEGADIVITGRVADAALFVGPLLHEFGWAADDWQRLAQAMAAGHLLECSGQGSGGNFGAAKMWQRIPDLAHIGYPIAEVSADGSFVVSKAAGTGGRINFHTLRQQLLYEVHNPMRYLSPDVVLDMSQLELTELAPDQVRVSGAQGHSAPPKLKLVAGYRNGWMGHCVVGLCWPDALAKAEAVTDIIRTKLKERGMEHDELHAELLGHNSFLGPHAQKIDDSQVNEVWLRLAIRTPHQNVAEAFPRLFPALALSGPPFMGGFHGIAPASQLLGLWPSLISRDAVEPHIQIHHVALG